MPRDGSRPDSDPVLLAIAELRDENRTGRHALRDELLRATDQVRDEVRSVRSDLRQHAEQDSALFRQLAIDAANRHGDVLTKIAMINGARESEQRAADRAAEREFFHPPPPAGAEPYGPTGTGRFPAVATPPENCERESFWPALGRGVGRAIKKYSIHLAVAILVAAATTVAHRCGPINKTINDVVAPSR